MSGVEVRDKRFESVIGRSVEFERLATACIFTEGPLWHRREKYVLFSDMPGDHLRRWSEKDGVTTFREPCNKSNGLAWDLQGRLLACEHASSHLTRTEPDGKITILASHYEGKELNSPNDLAVKSDGCFYFSDPSYGRKEHFGLPREPQLAFRGVYRLSADGKTLTLLADDFGQPNGVCFSGDEKTLFVSDTDRQHVRAFDVKADGTLANSRIWAKTVGEGAGAPDGLKMDGTGNVYSCGPGGIHVFAPDATCLGVIKVPEYTANFCWGDDDLKSLFITASTSLYRIRVATPGTPQMR
jgi:gluconolactonase